jgi:hypothetical protein
MNDAKSQQLTGTPSAKRWSYATMVVCGSVIRCIKLAPQTAFDAYLQLVESFHLQPDIGVKVSWKKAT